MSHIVGYLHALSSSQHHCHSRAQQIANISCCQVQCYFVVSLNALGQYHFNVFMMRCLAKLFLLNMSRRRKSYTPFLPSPLPQHSPPLSAASIACRAAAAGPLAVQSCVCCVYGHHVYAPLSSYLFLSVGTNRFQLVRIGSTCWRESPLADSSPTIAEWRRQLALGTGSRVTVTGHRLTST